MNPQTSLPAPHPFEALFGPAPALLIYIETGCPEEPPNLIAARLLQMLLLNWIDDCLLNSGFYQVRSGFFVCATVRDIIPVLRAMQVAWDAVFIPSETEIAWWDHSELIVRDWLSPNGLPFERLVPDIMAAHRRFLSLTQATP